MIAQAASTAAPSRAEMTMVEVELGSRSYPIYIGQGLLLRGELLRRHVAGSTVLVVTNETIAGLYLDRIVAGLSAPDGTGRRLRVATVVLPDGEQHKDISTLEQVWTAALEARLDRSTTFVALGGGVVGDMTGFAAAAYQRGVAFLQVPTTVMAQVDSSVGGKTGVNHALGKNMIGAFHQPRCVLVDTDALNTLPDRELASGLAEVVKYGLISDAELFNWLEMNIETLLSRDPGAWAHAIKRSCEIKASVVAADEQERGLRATLNLGHTFGHAIEAAAGYGAWLHGEAVAAGTAMAADLSRRLGWIEPEIEERVVALLDAARLPIKPPKGMTPAEFMRFMSVDKKVEDGTLRLVLLKGPLGSCVVTSEFDPTQLDATLQHFCS